MKEGEIRVVLSLGFDLELSDPRYTTEMVQEVLEEHANDYTDGRRPFNTEAFRNAACEIVGYASHAVPARRASVAMDRLPLGSELRKRGTYALSSKLPLAFQDARPDWDLKIEVLPSRPVSTKEGREDVFVCGSVSLDPKAPQKTYCPDCIPSDLVFYLGESWVDTWTLFSDGWVAAPICDECHLAISVYVNGEEAAPKKGTP